VQADGTVIRWLSDGLQSLRMNVPFKPAKPINPIKGIDIGYFNLTFDESNPWNPVASTDQIKATMGASSSLMLQYGNRTPQNYLSDSVSTSRSSRTRSPLTSTEQMLPLLTRFALKRSP
jgi:hypothetical protein